MEGREFTHTEQRVINRMLKLRLKAIATHGRRLIRWKLSTWFGNAGEIYQYHHLAERHCGYTPFHVEIGNLTGEFNICLPSA